MSKILLHSSAAWAILLGALFCSCASSPRGNASSAQNESAADARHSLEDQTSENGASSTVPHASSSEASSQSKASVQLWWSTEWRQQQQLALQCWQNLQCNIGHSKPPPDILHDMVRLKEGPIRRRAAQTALRAHFLWQMKNQEEGLQKLSFVDANAIFLLEDLAQLLTEHGAVEVPLLLEHAEPALRHRNDVYDRSRRGTLMLQQSYDSWAALSVGTSKTEMRRWAVEVLQGTAHLKTERHAQTKAVMAALRGQTPRGQALHQPLLSRGFLSSDGSADQEGQPRCFLGETPAATMRTGIATEKLQESMLFVDAIVKAQCRSARRQTSARWAMAMGSIVERQMLHATSSSWRLRLLAASFLALSDEGSLHAAAEKRGNAALFLSAHEEKRAKGTSFWLSLVPNGDVEMAFFAAVLGGAVDHIMAIRHGSAWPQKNGMDKDNNKVEKTLESLLQVFHSQGIEGIFKIAGEQEVSAALLLTRL